MIARAALPLVLLVSTSAPFQCGSNARPEHHMEEEPADALYKLAERFHAAGDQKARVETLRFLVERYPSSRFAQAARLDLEQLGAASK